MDYQAASEQFAQTADSDLVVREAALFAAGSYPDRRLNVTEADIARLAQSQTPVPVFVEHQNSRFQLGKVLGFTADGKWLRGRLGLFPEASKLIDRLGVKGLSVGVTRGLDAIREVSVTDSPRVAGAALFSGDDLVHFSGGEEGEDLMDKQELEKLSARVTEMESQVTAANAARLAAEAQAKESADLLKTFSQKLLDTEQARIRDRAQVEVEKFSAAGVLPPAVHAHAVALLTVEDQTLKFSDKEGKDVEMSVAETFRALVAGLPSVKSGPIKGAGLGTKLEIVERFKKQGLDQEQAEIAAKFYTGEGEEA